MLRSDFLLSALSTVAVGPRPPAVLPQSNIGVCLPLSGPMADYGRALLRGIQAAVDETNRFNATLIRAWGIRTFDDQNNSAVATSNAFAAAADPSIIGIIGNLTLDVTLAAMPQYQNARFACVVPALTADTLTARGYHNVFRLPTKDSSEGQLFARAVLDKKSTVVRAIAIEGEYGLDVARGFVQQANANHHDADTIAALATNDPENVAAVTLKSAPKLIFLAGKPDRLGPIAKALRKQGYNGDFGCSDGFFSMAVTGPYGELLNGSLVASSTPPLERVPSMFQLMQDFRGEVGGVDGFSAYGYAAAQLLIQATGRANGSDRFSVLSQIQSGGTFNLLVGQYSFGYNGDAILPNIYLYRITKKGFDYVRAAVPNGFVV